MPPEVEEDYLPFLWSNSKWHTWSTMRKFSILNLSSLHPSSKPHLGKLMLGRTIKLVGYCSVTHYGGRTMSLTARLCLHLLGQAQDGIVQWIQGARGLAVEGTTPDTHGRLHGLRS